MAKFMEYKSPAMREPHVWLWIVEQEKLSVVIELYDETIKFEYNIFHSTYVPAKTEGIVAINEARGNKQVRAVSLIFLTYNELRDGRPPIRANNTFKKIYSIPHPLLRIYCKRPSTPSSPPSNSGWSSTSLYCRVWS